MDLKQLGLCLGHGLVGGMQSQPLVWACVTGQAGISDHFRRIPGLGPSWGMGRKVLTGALSLTEEVMLAEEDKNAEEKSPLDGKCPP
jgi:hypothetical protein